MDAGPNLVKHSYAAGEMGVGTAKMAAKRAREVKVITCAFTVPGKTQTRLDLRLGHVANVLVDISDVVLRRNLGKNLLWTPKRPRHSHPYAAKTI